MAQIFNVRQIVDVTLPYRLLHEKIKNIYYCIEKNANVLNKIKKIIDDSFNRNLSKSCFILTLISVHFLSAFHLEQLKKLKEAWR